MVNGQLLIVKYQHLTTDYWLLLTGYCSLLTAHFSPYHPLIPLPGKRQDYNITAYRLTISD